MADHAGDDVIAYWVSVPERYKAALYSLRKWPQLKMATDKGLIWLKGLLQSDMESPDLLRIPMLERYCLKNTRLYPLGKQLPKMVAPTLLWSDLQRGLRVELPAENFNYFGVDQTHRLELVASTTPKPVTASIINLKLLETYLYDAPQVRVAGLRWLLLGTTEALVVGTPLLPVPGRDYYQMGCFLIPAGFAFRYANLVSTYERGLSDARSYLYLVNEDGGFSKVRRADFNYLSKGSFAGTFGSPG